MSIRVLTMVATPGPIVLWEFAFGVVLLTAAVDRDFLARAGLATAGSALVAYGLRELLRAWGGGYYCCNHLFYATLGLAVAGLGWVGLLAALRGPPLDVD